MRHGAADPPLARGGHTERGLELAERAHDEVTRDLTIFHERTA